MRDDGRRLGRFSVDFLEAIFLRRHYIFVADLVQPATVCSSTGQGAARSLAHVSHKGKQDPGRLLFAAPCFVPPMDCQGQGSMSGGGQIGRGFTRAE